ncbi:MAG TPA: chromosomal replication initiator protein DnaA [Solirubrobacteraceae bacterium]|nr:chromosomal replication initiator protein DnaA [Solirubrobacteraceae bacterium]
MSAELEHIWSALQAELAEAVDESAYRIWLAGLQPADLVGNRLLLEAPAGALSWVRDRFGRVLQACAERASTDIVVELIERGSLHPSQRIEHTTITRPRRAALPENGSRGRREIGTDLREHDHGGESRPGPLANPKLTFEQFVIGDSNRLAHAAALAVAEMPAQAYNPLFICGPPGVGKTHLLGSIAKLLLSHNPSLTVRCTTGEAFTNEFIDSLSAGRADSFKARFRDVDVLLLDDVQFLERKAKTEEELFHTFNALHDGGRQIVLSSDRPPHDLQALEDRLRERFAAGLVADIQPPDLPTRLTILHKRAHHDDVELADELALRVIAERIDDNVRALEGALIRVVAYSSLTGRPLTGDLAEEVLDTLYPRPAPGFAAHSPGMSIEHIQTVVGGYYGVSTGDLISAKRTADVALARQLAMYLSRELTDHSLPAIGREFGGRDHTTVLHACRRVTSRISDDPTVRNAVDELRSRLSTCPQPSSSPPSDRVA